MAGAKCESCGKMVVLRKGACVLCGEQIDPVENGVDIPAFKVLISLVIVLCIWMSFITYTKYQENLVEKAEKDEIARVHAIELQAQQKIRQQKMAARAKIMKAEAEKKAAYDRAQKEAAKKQRKTMIQASGFPASNASYNEIQSQTGCQSKYSKAKKKDIFKSQYENHWFTWTGKVMTPDSGKTGIDMDGSLPDIVVYFADKKAGYNLLEGQKITVTFLMKSSGGCFLSYVGREAMIR